MAGLLALCGTAQVLAASVERASDPKVDAFIELREPLRSASGLLRLGDIAHLRTRDLALLRTLMQVPLAPVPPGPNGAAIDREAVERALRWRGLRPGTELRIAWSGAARTWVRRAEQPVSGQQLAAAARTVLDSAATPGTEADWQIERLPRPFDVPEGRIQLEAGSPLLASGGQRLRVPVTVRVDGQPHRVAWVGFEAMHAGAASHLATIAPEAPDAPRSDERRLRASSPAVLARAVAGHPARAATALASTASEPTPTPTPTSARALAVRRGDTTQLVLRRGGVSVTAPGRALQDGAAGDDVRVQLAGSAGEFIAHVSETGRLELAP